MADEAAEAAEKSLGDWKFWSAVGAGLYFKLDDLVHGLIT
ncbi:hypothetical protein AGR5A_pb0034 [Agrobacterium genomosp. 5 str. CFBP 6626]|nr:hypothetical protein AGR5A_pb0034 [Agrobacterium genomosp. 5 str. CFBP 6626]